MKLRKESNLYYHLFMIAPKATCACEYFCPPTHHKEDISKTKSHGKQIQHPRLKTYHIHIIDHNHTKTKIRKHLFLITSQTHPTI
jgi:hypothetical protein